MTKDVRTKDGRFELRLSVQKLEEWRGMARSEGISLASWIEMSCDAVAAEVNSNQDKAILTKLERSQLIAKATPQATRTPLFAGGKTRGGPDWK